MNPQDLIARAYKNCHPEVPVKKGEPFWVDLDRKGLRGAESCASKLHKLVKTNQLAGDHTYELFSGFRGSGKTSMLLDLETALDADGFTTVYIDTLEYLDLNMPIETYEILLAIAAQIDKRVDAGSWRDAKPLWDRVVDFLKSEVEVKDVGFSIPSLAEFKAEIKSNHDFRTELRALLDRRQKNDALIREVKTYLAEAIARLRGLHPERKGVVLIVDNLEQLRGQEMDRIHESVERVFLVRARELRMPCHVIYTIPPWLRFTGTSASVGGMMLPMCKVIDPESRKTNPDGVDLFFELAGKRVELNALFGSDRPEQIERLIRMSGGYPRDFLRLLRGVLFRLIDEPSLPVAPATLDTAAERAISDLTTDYEGSLFIEDIEYLVHVESTHRTPPTSVPIKRLADWLDHHFILSYNNGEPHYDLHPLIRDRSTRYTMLKEMWQAEQAKREKNGHAD